MSIQAISSSLSPAPGSMSLPASGAAAAVPLPGAQKGTEAPHVIGAAGQTAQQSLPPGLAQVQQALDEVREAISPVAQNLLFSIEDETGQTIVKVVDASTDEVIRQIPSVEIVAIAKALGKLQGLLIRQQA